MARPLRFVPDNCLVEVTTRTLQGRFLLKPSEKVNEAVLGVLGRAAHLWPKMELFAFVFLSNHYHMLLRTPDVGTLSAFVGFINSNVAREVGRLHAWRERFWGRRFRSIPVLDDAAAMGRLRYILAQGVKEGLVASPLEWPGPSCAAALTTGVHPVGTWYDRTRAYLAARRGEVLETAAYSQKYAVPLKPLPAWEKLTKEEQQSHARQLVRDIETTAAEEVATTARRLPGAETVLAQDPHARPTRFVRSPAPFVHAFCPCMRTQFRRRYRAFAKALRAVAARVRAVFEPERRREVLFAARPRSTPSSRRLLPPRAPPAVRSQAPKGPVELVCGAPV